MNKFITAIQDKYLAAQEEEKTAIWQSDLLKKKLQLTDDLFNAMHRLHYVIKLPGDYLIRAIKVSVLTGHTVNFLEISYSASDPLRRKLFTAFAASPKNSIDPVVFERVLGILDSELSSTEEV